MADPLVKSNPTQAEYFNDIVGTIREPLLVLDASLRVLGANRSFYKFFKVKAGETIGKLVYDLGNSQWDIPGLRLLLETILPQKAAFHDYNVEHDFPIIGRRILLLNARRISRLPNKAAWILLAFEDVTERMETERKLQVSEERFRRAFETDQDGMLLIKKTGGQILNSNQSAEHMLGYSKKTLRKKNMWELGILKDERQFRETSLYLEEQGVVDFVDKTIPTRSGGNIPADVYLMDRAAVIQCNIRDVTTRKQADEALQKSEEKFRNLFNSAEVGMFRTRLDGSEILDFNEKYLKILGYTIDEIKGKPSKMLWADKDERDRMTELLKAEGQVTDFEFVLLTKQGETRTCITSLRLYPDQGILEGSIQDITERKRAEDALRMSEDRYRMLMDTIPDGVIVHSQGRILYANPASAKHIGAASPADLIGRTMLDFVHPDFRKLVLSRIEQTMAGAPASIEEEKLIRLDGKIIDIQVTNFQFSYFDQPAVLVVFVDITERKQSEEKLVASENELRSLFAAMTDVVFVLDGNGRYLRIAPTNPINLYRQSEDLLGKTVHEVLPREQADYMIAKIREAIQTKQTTLGEYALDIDGKEIWFASSASRLSDNSVIWVAHDITERKQAESKLKEYSEHLEEMVAERTHELRGAHEQLVRKEKLAVLGTLAGGVGHELRNPLGVISNSVYYLKMVQPEANEKIKKHLATITQEVHNAARIVSDLLDYAREISSEPKPSSVHELVEQTLSRFPVPASIQVSLKIPADLPPVYTDPLQVEQILGNLITNACQAMANPSLDTKAGSAKMSGRCKLTISARKKMEMVAIAVKDSGSGIAPENFEKLFEPLFSTKVTGIGLGLVVSKKLAEANGGRIEVKSQVGKGSTFSLYLRLHHDVEEK
ncbi:MAG: PAS domain S-box protein [Anaerolineales bacterium]|jgi:PAS domain S-box-containing protein